MIDLKDYRYMTWGTDLFKGTYFLKFLLRKISRFGFTFFSPSI